jgi:Uma2 family endonuclease
VGGVLAWDSASVVHVDPAELHRECLHLPRHAVRFPVEWRAPAGFRASELDTWPKLDGRLEYVAGRIRYMPPCGEEQQDVATDVTGTLHEWVRVHPDYVVGSNEAGMLLDGEVRAADTAIWHRKDAGTSKGFRRAPPVLAVEIAGEDDDEPSLREKAAWYLSHGASTVWIVLPEPREVLVLTAAGETRHGRGSRLPLRPELPDLTPAVDAFFMQIDRR